jgi:membrane protease YdiL (CAAX protease family)
VSNPFWNPTERRLRAFWRILLQGLLFLLFAVAFASLVGVLPSFSSAVDTLDPTDPNYARQYTDFIMNHPVYSQLASLAAFLAFVISIWLAARSLDRRRFADLGLHFNGLWWADFGFGLFLGALLMAGIFLVELIAGWVTITGTFASPRLPFPISISLSLLTFIYVGIQEELLSRGYHLRNIAEGSNHPRLGPRRALLAGYLISSAIFGLLHLANPNATWFSTFNIFVAGLWLGLGYLLTGELALPIGLHITWNFFQGRVFGFPVSGTTNDTSFIAIYQGGPTLFTGGAFGPEAGLLGLLAIFLGALLTVAWVRRTRGRAKLREDLAVFVQSRGADEQRDKGVEEQGSSDTKSRAGARDS